MRTLIKKIIVSILIVEARILIRRKKPKIIAITGSVGKTTTKDTVFSVISKQFHARKSEKSFNSDIGIPLTILGLQNAWTNPLNWISNIVQGAWICLFAKSYPEWLVLEVGADRKNDIRKNAPWLAPDMVIITRFGDVPAHVEFFDSRRDLINEKASLVDYMKTGGVLIVNGDDDDSLSFADRTFNRTIVYSLNGEGSVVGSNEAIRYEPDEGGKDTPVGIIFKVTYGGNVLPVIRRGGLGLQHVYPALAAISAGIAVDMNLVEIGQALEDEYMPPGRMRLIHGNKGSFIIDDTYNSSPVALHEALNTLDSVKILRSRKIAVLGDMLELGKHTQQEHIKAGEHAAKVAKILVTVGLRARHIAQGALDTGMDEASIFQFEDSVEAGKFVDSIIHKNDVVLVKGSQFVRMEKTVEEIMACPENKEKLLVRQDKEWASR